MLRFAFHATLALALVVVATGCGARTTAGSPTKVAMTTSSTPPTASCTQGKGDAHAERECLRNVLDELAGTVVR